MASRKSSKPLTQEAAALKHGWRSGLEEKTAEFLTGLGVPFEYEQTKLSYSVEEVRSYTPDFRLPQNGVIIETKGRFVTADRKKMKTVKKQYPHLDIRLLFSNPNARISKTSKTTYAMWAEQHGFPWAKGPKVPLEWLEPLTN